MMKYLAYAGQRTFQFLKNHWLLLGILIILQLGFFISFGYVGLMYQMKIFQNIQGVLEPIQGANYNVTSLQEGSIFTHELSKVYENYTLLLQNLRHLMLWLLGLFLIGNGILWIGTISGLQPSSMRVMIQRWFRYAMLSVIVLGPILILFAWGAWQMMKAGVVADSVITFVKMAGYVLIIMYFFLEIAYALLSAGSWKDLGRQWLSILKKVHLTLLIAVINFIVLGASLALLVLVMNLESLALLILVSLLVVIIFVLTRIFWIAAVQELVHETHSH